MSAILDDIADLLPSGYNIVYGSLPEEGDCVVLNEPRTRTITDTLEGKFSQLETEVSIYVRHSNSWSNYKQIKSDLLKLCSELEGYINLYLNDKLIEDVKDFDLYFIGHDEDGNLLFSMNFTIVYKINSRGDS